MKRITTLLAGVLITSLSIGQVLDQSNTASTGSGWLVNSGGYQTSGQSFTCGISGDLTSLVVSIDADNPVYPLIAGDFVVNIRDGAGFGGTILGSETFAITGTETTGDYAINFSTPIALTSGNVYTYEIDETSGTGQIMMSASSDVYPGGILYNNSSFYTSYDYKFKTFMTLPCSIADQTVTATDTELCLTNTGTSITTGSSESGMYYYLRDNTNDTIVDGPIAGTGSGLSFNTGALSSSMEYNVYAISPSNVTALTMDGTNEYVITPNLTQDNTWTYETWVKPNDFTPDWSGIITANSSVGTGMWFQLALNASGELKWESYSPSLSIASIGSIINNNTWHHVAVTCDGTNITFYIDGIEVAQQAFTGGAMDRPLHIMAERAPTHWVAGQVDETMVWDYARSSAEILSDMTACLDGSESGLMIYYDYEDGSGTTVTDLAGTDHNGTLMNMEESDWTNITDFISNCNDCNLEMTTTVSIAVQDTVAPVADTPTLSDVNGTCSISSLTAPTATDNCASSVTVTNDATLPITTIGTTVVTWTYDDGNGNTSMQTQNVIIADPAIDITTSLTDFVITANNAGADAYQWIDCDDNNSSISGATNQTFEPTEDGNYAVVVTEGLCSDTSDCVTIAGLGIENHAFTDLQLFPNPSNGEFTIITSEKNITVTVYSLDGKVIVDQVLVNNNKETFQLKDISKGAYFVKVQNQNHQKTLKLIIE